MAESTTSGELKEVSLIREDDNGLKFVLEDFERILCQEDCRNNNVVVISATGSRRTGKTFLLNYMVRYLQNPSNADWMGEPNTPLTGFNWKGGHDRVTRGINTLNTLFPLESSTGEKIFFMLLDTEGSEDLQNNVDKSARVFAVSALLSSVVVHSINCDITSTVLNTMKLFVDYGKRAEQTSSEKPLLQNLLMLVRNFKYPSEEYPFGFEGGANYWANVRSQSIENHAETYEAITSTSETIKCFLLPYPGEYMVEDVEFDGACGKLTDRFRKGLHDLIVGIMEVAMKKPETLNGVPLTCGNLYLLCEEYSNRFSGDALPKVLGIHEANAMVHLQIVFQECIQLYTREMKEELETTEDKTLDSWDNINKRILEKVIDKLQTISVSSIEGFKVKKVKELHKWISEQYTVVRDKREKEIQVEAKLSDEELYNGLYDAYVEQMNEKITQCLDVEQIRTFHEQYKRHAIDTLKREMLSKKTEFLKYMEDKLEESIGEKHAADNRWIKKLQNNSNALCFIDCLNKYQEIMNSVRNEDDHFNSTDEMKDTHTRAMNTAEGILKQNYKGPSDSKAVTWHEIKSELNAKYKQYKVSQRNHESLQRSVINHDASSRAALLYQEYVENCFHGKNKFDLYESLAGAHALAMSRWRAERKGCANDYGPIQEELFSTLEALQSKFETEYDNGVEHRKIGGESALIFLSGLRIVIPTPVALWFQKRKLKKLRNNTSNSQRCSTSKS